MESLKLIEDGSMSGVKISDDGYLTAQVKCARSGIQQYRGLEIGLPSLDIANVWRPEDEVFSEKSMLTYANRPATDDHPDDLVDATNSKALSVGHIGSKVIRSGDFVEVPLMISDATAVQKIQDGKRGLSMGYLVDIKHESGTTPDGEAYDAIQTNLRMNHIALVDQGRAGAKVRIGDSWSVDRNPDRKPQETETMKLRTIVVDGLSVETTDAAALAIEKLQADNKAANELLDSEKATHDAAIATAKKDHKDALDKKDAELATKDSEIDELKKKVLTGDDLDKLVADREVFMTKAKAILGDDADLKGKSNAAIKALAVAKVRGEDFAKDKSETYIDVAYDMLDVPEGDSVRNALSDISKNQPANDNGQSEYEKRLTAGRAGVK